MVGGRSRLIPPLLALGLALAGPASAAPPTDRVLPADQYTSDKGRRLAQAYARDLSELNAEIYHCLPWVDVQKNGLGFFKPKHLPGDERYLSLNIVVEQQPSAEFTSFTREERASRMFSRYVPPMLRRLAQNVELLRDPRLDGFTVIVSWMKAEPRRGGPRPVNETIAAFVPKPTAVDYVEQRLPVGQLADMAYVLAWDGDTPTGRISLTAWDDDFVRTYTIKGYQPDPGVTCAGRP
jgi:hypothetical protein